MGLKEDLLRGIYAYGYERPSAVQQRAIVPILQGRDVVAQAQSGTGKSSLIALCACQLVDPRVRELSFLMVSLRLFSLFLRSLVAFCLGLMLTPARPRPQNQKNPKTKTKQRPSRHRLPHPRARPPDRAPHPLLGRLP
jgi:hypothetical protein